VGDLLLACNQPPWNTNSSHALGRLIFCCGLFCSLFAISIAQLAIGSPLPQQSAGRTKVAEGEYAIIEHHNSGAAGPFQEEVYGFHESWTLWRAETGQYQVDGVRRFESPKGESHSNRFNAELTRDLTVIRTKEFAKLKWVQDSGPLSCEFLPTQMDCSSGGSDPKREIKLRTPAR
jgi:hypothetical protein